MSIISAMQGLLAAGTTPGGSAWYDIVFLPGNVGMAFDFNDLSSLYQDTSGTVPVTTAGDPIGAVRCQITSALATLQGSYTASLAYDAVRSIYYCAVGTTTTGTTPLFRSTGTLPSGLLGDTAFTLVAVADWDPAQESLYAHFGAVSPSNGNSGTLGHLTDPTIVLDFLQWGGGRGTKGSPLTGVASAIGAKGPRNPDTSTSTALIYVDGVAISTSGLMNGLPVNVVTQNFDIARVTTAGRRIYTVGVINRHITALEAAAVHAAAL